jgi:hypothetical protein
VEQATFIESKKADTATKQGKCKSSGTATRQAKRKSSDTATTTRQVKHKISGGLDNKVFIASLFSLSFLCI